MLDKMMRKRVVAGLLSFAWFGYAIHLQIADKPFFLGSDLVKHKVTNWLYENIGTNILSLIFVILGVLFAYWSWRGVKERRD
mgnify:CR=1 FL=1